MTKSRAPRSPGSDSRVTNVYRSRERALAVDHASTSRPSRGAVNSSWRIATCPVPRVVSGNHEFNYGVPHLDSAIAKSTFPFLAANVRNARNAPAYPATTIVQKNGVSIGIVGATTPGSMSSAGA